MRVGDLIAVSKFPAVIRLEQALSLREDLGAAGEELLAGFVEQYFTGEADTRRAVETLLASLARSKGPGQAFLLRGPYGSGKSHLLGLLALLCDSPVARQRFFASHPEFSRFAPGLEAARRIVVAVSLDEAGALPLEEVVFRAVEAELARRWQIEAPLTDRSHFLQLVTEYVLPLRRDELEADARRAGVASWEEVRRDSPEMAASLGLRFLRRTGFPLEYRRSRLESLRALSEVMRAHSIAGLVLALDEISLFLGSKKKRELDADAAFLQFLAQQGEALPLWLIGSVTRGLEEAGDIDGRTLRQIRDRFHTGLSLSLAELGELIERKFILRRRPERWRGDIGRLHESYSKTGERPAFSGEQLARLYPLNPLCLEPLRAAAGALFSQTRSALGFLQQALSENAGPSLLEAPAQRLLSLDDMFDYFAPELRARPELARHWRAFEFLRSELERIAPAHSAAAEALLKALALLAVVNLRMTARELAGAMAGSRRPELWERPGLLPELLRELRRRGAYLEAGRVAGEEEYFLDVGSQAPEVLRRRLNEWEQALPDDDARLLQTAIAASSNEEFPLASLVTPRPLQVEWQNTRRSLLAAVRDLRELGPAELRNLADLLASAHSREDVFVFLALPATDLTAQSEAWRAASQGLSGRFSAALVAWLPRPATAAEWQLLREYAAARRLLDDASLGESRLGREVRALLQERESRLGGEARSLLSRLFFEGELVASDGSKRFSPEGREESKTLAAWLSRALEPCFAALFPRFAPLAPRRRLVGKQATNQVIADFVRLGEAEIPFGATLESYLASFLAPLGLVENEGRRWKLALGSRELLPAALGVFSRGGAEKEFVSYGELERALAKSEFGLAAEQAELVVAALIKLGYLVALDAFYQPLRLELIAPPLSERLPSLAPGQTLPAGLHKQALELAAALGLPAEKWNQELQEALWDRLLAWKRELTDALPGLQESLARLPGQLGQPEALWQRSQRLLQEAGRLLKLIQEDQASAAGLRRLLAAGEEAQLAAVFEGLARLRRFLQEEAGEVVALHAYLSHPELRPGEKSLLAGERSRLLRRLASGEEMLAARGDEEKREGVEAWLQRGRRWLRAYRKQYLAWHEQAHAASRFLPYQALRQENAYLAAERLARLPLAGAAEFAALRSSLEAEMSKRCPGDDLPAALGASPVCPRCRVALGQAVSLQSVARFREESERAFRLLLGSLLSAESRELLRRRAAAEEEGEIPQALDGLLRLSPEAGPAELLGALEERMLPWLKRQLAGRASGKRSLASLAEGILGKELSRPDLEARFRRWLDPEEQLGEDDFLEITE
jgi:hypothetical protein